MSIKKTVNIDIRQLQDTILKINIKEMKIQLHIKQAFAFGLFLLFTLTSLGQTDSLTYQRERQRMIEKSKANQRKYYNAKKQNYKKSISLVDYSNISGTKSMLLETGLIVPAYFDKNRFRLNTYSIQFSKISRKNKTSYYGGLRYLDNKDDNKYFKWYLLEGGARWFLFSIPLFDFRLDTGLGMGAADKNDYRLGKRNTYYALSGKLGLQAYLKLNTYCYLYTAGKVISIYDTKTLDTYMLLTLGVSIMM